MIAKQLHAFHHTSLRAKAGRDLPLFVPPFIALSFASSLSFTKVWPTKCRKWIKGRSSTQVSCPSRGSSSPTLAPGLALAATALVLAAAAAVVSLAPACATRRRSSKHLAKYISRLNIDIMSSKNVSAGQQAGQDGWPNPAGFGWGRTGTMLGYHTPHGQS